MKIDNFQYIIFISDSMYRKNTFILIKLIYNSMNMDNSLKLDSSIIRDYVDLPK